MSSAATASVTTSDSAAVATSEVTSASDPPEQIDPETRKRLIAEKMEEMRKEKSAGERSLVSLMKVVLDRERSQPLFWMSLQG